jgi:hypothetical protein
LVEKKDAEWQVCVKVPLGLTRGWYDLKVRVADGDWSAPLQIGVGEHESAPSLPEDPNLKIANATDGKTWEAYTVRLGADSWLSLWIEGLPDAARAEDVRVRMNGTDLPAAFLSARDAKGHRQLNAKVPGGLKPAEVRVALIFENRRSREVEVRLVSEQ